MALSRTITQLIGLCKRRSDKENDEHVDDDEWKELISEVYGELHGAVAKTGARYFETEATISPTGAASYSLPSDHLSTVGVDRVTDAAGSRVDLVEIMVQERTIFSGRTGEAWGYSFTGTNIKLYPTPSSGTYKHIYVPQPTDYSASAGSTSIDLINNDGMKFLVWSVASIALHKGDANQIRAVEERDRAMAGLTEWAVLRSLTMPKRRQVRDVDLGLDQYGQWTLPGSYRWSPP